MSIENAHQQRRFGSVGYAVIAVICAGFAAYLMVVVMKAKGYKQEKKVPVVVATEAIGAGHRLHKDDVKVVEMAESLIPQGAVRTVESLFPEGKEAPVAATGILSGEVVSTGRLGDPDKGTAMAGKVRDGYRAIAVTVDEAIARSRLVFPGAMVDIVGTFRDSRVSFSRLLIENIRVLSLESQTDVETIQSSTENDRRANDTVVTIEVTPEQAEIVALAARHGKLDLVLRNATDDGSIPTPGASTADLLAAKEITTTEPEDEADDDDDDDDDRRKSRRARRDRKRSRVKRRPPSRDKRDRGGSSTIEVLRSKR